MSRGAAAFVCKVESKLISIYRKCTVAYDKY